jgi:hypothetical protein
VSCMNAGMPASHGGCEARGRRVWGARRDHPIERGRGAKLINRVRSPSGRGSRDDLTSRGVPRTSLRQRRERALACLSRKSVTVEQSDRIASEADDAVHAHDDP